MTGHARQLSADLGRPTHLDVYAHVAFNQDDACFACATQDGFVIFNSDPLKCNVYRVLGGGVVGVEMLFRCNHLAILSGGPRPAFDRHQVTIWDDSATRISCQLDFSANDCNEVLAVRLRRDRICVVLMDCVKVFTLTNEPQPLHILPTANNPLGLCSLCPSSRVSLLAYPAVDVKSAIGCVDVVDLANVDKHRRHIKAHDSPLQCMQMHAEGTFLATASRKGTLIRVFDCATGKLAYELRRGSNHAVIQSIAFGHHFPLLCCTSDHGTLHIFSLNSKNSSSTAYNDSPTRDRRRSPSCSSVEMERENHNGAPGGDVKTGKLMPKYFRSTQSAVKIDLFKRSNTSPSHGKTKIANNSSQLSINDAQQSVVCAFTEHDGHVIVVSRAGDYNKFSFNTSTGKYSREYYAKLADVIHTAQ